jgi:hypothetical protein
MKQNMLHCDWNQVIGKIRLFSGFSDQIVQHKVLHMLMTQYILYEFNLFYSVNDIWQIIIL